MIHELKRYIPHDGKADALLQRFRDTTMPIFKRLGISLLHCWTAPDEPGVLYYLVSFADSAASDKAWAAFGADAQWKAAKAASETAGPLLASQSTVKLAPAAFSPDGNR